MAKAGGRSGALLPAGKQRSNDTQFRKEGEGLHPVLQLHPAAAPQHKRATQPASPTSPLPQQPAARRLTVEVLLKLGQTGEVLPADTQEDDSRCQSQPSAELRKTTLRRHSLGEHGGVDAVAVAAKAATEATATESAAAAAESAATPAVAAACITTAAVGAASITTPAVAAAAAVAGGGGTAIPARDSVTSECIAVGCVLQSSRHGLGGRRSVWVRRWGALAPHPPGPRQRAARGSLRWRTHRSSL